MINMLYYKKALSLIYQRSILTLQLLLILSLMISPSTTMTIFNISINPCHSSKLTNRETSAFITVHSLPDIYFPRTIPLTLDMFSRLAINPSLVSQGDSN